ncbi:MAG: nickel pincer cofactor biosynthesis protein LarB [Planctomycetota bacterium]|jgi:hypothetical protein|nr:nickel pincer cofactor biosynthesis protein LarB [Planctomycetota bacterium]
MIPRQLLEQVARGDLSVDAALKKIEPASDLGFAQVDHERAQRCGCPEVIFCDGKDPVQAADIAEEILTRAPRVLLTRAGPDHARELTARLPDVEHVELGRCLFVDRDPLPRQGLVAIVAAGTSDLPVAAEAQTTLSILGATVEMHVDVGVAGLHRLLERIPDIRLATTVVAIAGMEGALPSVVAGMIDAPVIAVPTSVGYGANFGGLAALLAMMNSCAAGVTVVNVDNGFGAGYAAGMINRRASQQGPDDPRSDSTP